MGLPSDFDPLTADAEEVAAVCCDLAQKDNAYDDDDLRTLLFNVGIEVCEPTYPDSFSSLVHCYVQWFVRDKWILDPLDGEQQQRIVDHVVFKILYDTFDDDVLRIENLIEKNSRMLTMTRQTYAQATSR